MLGSTEAAMLRFTTEGSGLPDHRHAEALREPPSRYAAGGKKTPIMLANVVVSQQRTIACIAGLLIGSALRFRVVKQRTRVIEG